ncbi:hypothetical protein AB0I81_26465 [Nonomuraea sp. NPDC050404]|uniref:hypothetical protein n=1 Tax=Nonomuraea sp. NPDC050404 TaxID=3155783 RepID=UPI0033DFE3DA
MTAAAPPRLRVPYITAYSEEALSHPLMFVPDPGATDGRRLSYADAVREDFQFGVLWARHGLHRGGRPEWKMVNSIRQRRCMMHLLCQVCGRSAAEPNGRIPWLVADDLDDDPAVKGYTNAPPTCAACAPESVAACPRLRQGATVYTAGRAEPYGVLANVLRPSRGKIITVERHRVIPLDAFHLLEYALAVQLVVTLDDLQPASLPSARSEEVPSPE